MKFPYQNIDNTMGQQTRLKIQQNFDDVESDIREMNQIAIDAETKSDQAVTTANNADGNATTALNNSQTAINTANEAKGTSETAETNSVTAINTANNAKATAEGIDSKAQTALNNSVAAINTANAAETKADSTQDQLDTIIIESGTSDAETIQARGGFPILNDRFNSVDQQLAETNEKVNGIDRGYSDVIYTSLAALQAAIPAGDTKRYVVPGNVKEVDTLTITAAPTANGNVSITLNGVTTNVAVTAGVAEVSSLTISAIPTAAGNVTVTLNGVAVNVAVDPAVETTTDLVAAKIRGTAFAGWTTGGTGSTVTFTATAVGTKTDATYSAGSTGATGTMTTTTQGVNADTATTVATKIRGTSFPGWTTGGSGTTVTFTKNTADVNTAPVYSSGATGAAGTIVVTTAGVAPDGNWYYWNNTAWTPGGIFQGIGILNEAVTEAMLQDQAVVNKLKKNGILVPEKNLVDKYDIQASLYYSPGNNALRSNVAADYTALGFIEVEPGKTYTFSGYDTVNSAATGGYFNAGKQPVSAITFANTGVEISRKFTVPSGVKYVVLNARKATGSHTTAQLELGELPTSYESYSLILAFSKLQPFLLSGESLKEGSVSPGKTTFFEKKAKKNLIDPAEATKTLYYSPGSGAIATAANATAYGLTKLVEVTEGEWYIYSGSGAAFSGGYFGEGAGLQAGQAAISSINFTVPVDGVGRNFQVPLGSGIKYVAVNILKDTATQEFSGVVQLEVGEQATVYEPYTTVDMIKSENLPTTSKVSPVSAELNDAAWFGYLEGVTYGNESDKIANFRKHWIRKDKDLVVVNTGTSLTARSTEHCTNHPEATSRPPLFHSNNFASLAWDKIKWEGQQYRRYDYAGFFTEIGTFATQSNIADWDDAAYRHGLTRYADGGGSVQFLVPTGAWQFNFIYRTDKNGSENCTVAIAEGNGQMEVWNGSAWVEANGYTFSMKEAEKNISNITVPNPNDKNNAANLSFASYKIGGNTTYQKRLKMRCKSGAINSRGVAKNVTISAATGRLLYWGVEWSPREFMITYINAARGGHNLTVGSSASLHHYQENEIWGFKPDLIFTENPIHNSGAAGVPSSSDISEYWGYSTHNFFFNVNSPISLKSRAVANGVNPEWVIFNSSIAWNFGGIDDNGNLILAENADGRLISALDAQMMTYEWLKEMNPEIISINAVKFWTTAGRKIFGNLKAATVGSGKAGNTLTNEGSHWNDTGSKVMAKCILPVFDFMI